MIGLFADAASAKVVQISGTDFKDEINAKCAAGGGTIEGGTGGGYGCFNGNKGTSVDCDAKGHCVGWVPRRALSGGGLRGHPGRGHVGDGRRSDPASRRQYRDGCTKPLRSREPVDREVAGRTQKSRLDGNRC